MVYCYIVGLVWLGWVGVVGCIVGWLVDCRGRRLSRPRRGRCWPTQVKGVKDKTVACDALLPHEVIHSLASCDADLIFRSLMTGNRTPEDISAFWKHVRLLEPWAEHPALQNPDQDFSKLLAVQVHGDGAEMFRDSEYFVYSWSSLFSGSGLDNDVMLYRYPILVVSEKDMPDESDSWYENILIAGHNVETYVFVLQ